MNWRLLRLAVFAAALLSVLAALHSCGRKDDPIRPGDEPEPVLEEEEELF